MTGITNVLDRIREIQSRMDAFSQMARERESETVKATPSPAAESFEAKVRGAAVAGPSARPFDDIVARASRETKLPSELLHAVMQRESAYNPRAVSPKGAMGLMQLMPGTANDLDVKDPFAPEENVLGGAKYLRGLLERFQGNLPRALAAYNAGPEAVKDGRIPDYPETKEYVKHVMDSYLKMSGLETGKAAE
ncbi:MAG: lytic transglycosylase domain-containing protein [Spirochaetes bacterium]|nr:lytic transglycosylase domain-containing protein [Spirochaetota bacterium]